MRSAELATLLEVCGVHLFLLLAVIWLMHSTLLGRRPAGSEHSHPGPGARDHRGLPGGE